MALMHDHAFWPDDIAPLDEGRDPADFAYVYDEADPRPYFRTLMPLDYRIPVEAEPLFQAVMAGLRARRGRERLKVADLGCSYGINGALLKYGWSFADLAASYTAPETGGLSRADLLTRDRGRVAAARAAGQERPVEVIGLDIAANALAYALEAGFIDQGVCADLERRSLFPDEFAALRDIDLVIETGCADLVGERSYGALVGGRTGRRPWIAAFVLRGVPYDGVRATLASHGYVTERLPGRSFPQRRVQSAEELAETVAAVRALGRNPDGKETEGWLHAEFFLSRPFEDARILPLPALIGGPV